MVSKKDLEKNPDMTVEAALVPAPARYDRNVETFADIMAGGVDEVIGSDLLKGEVLDRLEGIPFLITHVTYRRGFPSRETKGLWLAYVSCEALIPDANYLAQRKISLDGTGFSPGDHIVFNDGSTGVQRQITAYLAARGFIQIPEGKMDGGMEESVTDLPPSEWINTHAGTSYFAPDGFMNFEIPVRLFAPRGTRSSEYANDYTQDGKTRYLA